MFPTHIASVEKSKRVKLIEVGRRGRLGLGQNEHLPDRLTSSGSSLAVATSLSCITGSIFS